MRHISLRRRVHLVLGLIAGLFALSTVISVNTFPVITNDSLSYLGHSNDLAGYGWVNFGYRQIGYPLFLASVRAVADAVTVEPLLFTAVFQRMLLLGSCTLAVWAWRWWSVPLVVFLLAAETLAYPNLILTEGLSLPVAVLLAVVMARILRFLDSDIDQRSRVFWILGGLVVTLASVLLWIRFPFAVFGIAPLIVVVAAWRTTFRKSAIALLSTFLLLSGALAVFLSAENADEYGVFFPTVQGERVKYWAAWTLTFVVHPENAEADELAPFYDDGSPYGFIGEVDKSEPNYVDRRDIYESSIEELLAVAGISVRGSQWISFAWALLGGRMDDVGRIVDGVTSSTRHDVDAIIHRNQFARSQGVEAFSDQFNGSVLPEAVITDPLGQRMPLPKGKTAVSVLLPLSLVIMLQGLAWSKTRWLAVVGLMVVVTYAAAIGSLRADNYRFLITTSAFGIATATGVVTSLATVWSLSRRNGPPRKLEP